MSTSPLASVRDAVADRIWKPSSTFKRLLTSRHVLDLQAIFVITVLVTVGLLFWHAWPAPVPTQETSVPAAATSQSAQSTSQNPHAAASVTSRNDAVKQELDSHFVGALLLISGTILAWVYQTGSKRLGVVDLFACEIITLCRVGTISDFMTRLINLYELACSGEAGGAPCVGRFTSEENYFPVFEGNAKDLQVLEADVVINVTAFYTYMKTFRDYMRQLAQIGPD